MGARMYAKEMQKLKKMGALNGTPDWSLMVPSWDSKWHTINVEFKRQGNHPNKYPQQVAVGNALKQVGQQYKVVFTLAQFKATVIAHLEPLPLTTQAPAVSVDLTQEQDKVEVQLSDDESEACPDQRFVELLQCFSHLPLQRLFLAALGSGEPYSVVRDCIREAVDGYGSEGAGRLALGRHGPIVVAKHLGPNIYVTCKIAVTNLKRFCIAMQMQR